MEGTLQQGLANLGQFMTSPQMPVLGGQMGAAILGQSSNPAQMALRDLGLIASNYGKSAIAAKEAEAQNAKSAAMNQWLRQMLPAMMGGVQLTPDGTAGPTDATAKINADGTFSVTTKGNTTTQGNNAPAGGQAGTPNTGQAVSPAPQIQPTQPPGFNPRMLPF